MDTLVCLTHGDEFAPSQRAELQRHVMSHPKSRATWESDGSHRECNIVTAKEQWQKSRWPEGAEQ